MKPQQADWFLRARLKMRHLQLFAALDEHRNIHRAAEELGMSQPAASKLLGELEYLLGVTLFERLPRGVAPNWYGEVLIRHSRAIMAELENAGDEITALRDGSSGRATIGTVAPGINLLAKAIERIQKERPNLQVSIDTDVSQNLVQRLAEGTFDFVLARIPDNFAGDRFVYEGIAEEQLNFVCRKGHPLTERKSVDLQDLAAFTWVLEPSDGLLRQRVSELFLSTDTLPPKQIIDTRSVLVSMAIIDRTDAITAISHDVVKLAFDPRRFHVITCKQRFMLKSYGLVRIRGKKLSPGSMQLMQMIRVIATQPDSRDT